MMAMFLNPMGNSSVVATNHSAMNHAEMDHSSMDHATMDHSSMGHAVMDHKPMDHAAMDHSAMGHTAMDHSTMGHTAMDHSTMGSGGMDHSSTDHAGMDHSSIDHTGMDHSSMGHGMSMAFHFGYTETVLFDSWRISGVGGLIGSMIGIFILSALYEGLKYYREYLFWKSYNALQYQAISASNDKGAIAGDGRTVRPSMCTRSHYFQTFLHLVQIVLSYFLMLIFMTYNVWLCIAVVLGAVVGYFLFGWKKSVIVDVTEHCH